MCSVARLDLSYYITNFISLKVYFLADDVLSIMLSFTSLVLMVNNLQQGTSMVLSNLVLISSTSNAYLVCVFGRHISCASSKPLALFACFQI